MVDFDVQSDGYGDGDADVYTTDAPEDPASHGLGVVDGAQPPSDTTDTYPGGDGQDVTDPAGGDGSEPNIVSYDEDGDGVVDLVLVDQDHDGRTDLALWDTNDDGVVDRAAYDSDGDGLIDLIYHDDNFDGQIDRVEQAPDGETFPDYTSN